VADVRIRTARREERPRIVELLADEDLGRGREHPAEDLSPYAAAFMDIEEDPRNELIVVEEEGKVIATLQLTFIPSLTHTGGERAQVEGVRLAAGSRSTGVGRQLLERAISRAQKRGCKTVQLTTDKRRAEAGRFYEALGFGATHEGVKLKLR
jgi:GNAT superfamily N-acetyltransferase